MKLDGMLLRSLGIKELQKRFMMRVQMIPFHQCWEWDGPFRAGGYGSSSINAKADTAPRVSYRLFKGEIPPNTHVCHSCDNPACVRPDHLWLGSSSDNFWDAVQKHRGGTGQKNVRKQQCIHGHALSGGNLIVYTKANGRMMRQCRQCGRDVQKRRRERLKAK